MFHIQSILHGIKIEVLHFVHIHPQNQIICVDGNCWYPKVCPISAIAAIDTDQADDWWQTKVTPKLSDDKTVYSGWFQNMTITFPRFARWKYTHVPWTPTFCFNQCNVTTNISIVQLYGMLKDWPHRLMMKTQDLNNNIKMVMVTILQGWLHDEPHLWSHRCFRGEMCGYCIGAEQIPLQMVLILELGWVACNAWLGEKQGFIFFHARKYSHILWQTGFLTKCFEWKWYIYMISWTKMCVS